MEFRAKRIRIENALWNRLFDSTSMSITHCVLCIRSSMYYVRWFEKSFKMNVTKMQLTQLLECTLLLVNLREAIHTHQLQITPIIVDGLIHVVYVNIINLFWNLYIGNRLLLVFFCLLLNSRRRPKIQVSLTFTRVIHLFKKKKTTNSFGIGLNGARFDIIL